MNNYLFHLAYNIGVLDFETIGDLGDQRVDFSKGNPLVQWLVSSTCQNQPLEYSFKSYTLHSYTHSPNLACCLCSPLRILLGSLWVWKHVFQLVIQVKWTFYFATTWQSQLIQLYHIYIFPLMLSLLHSKNFFGSIWNSVQDSIRFICFYSPELEIKCWPCSSFSHQVREREHHIESPYTCRHQVRLLKHTVKKNMWKYVIYQGKYRRNMVQWENRGRRNKKNSSPYRCATVAALPH